MASHNDLGDHGESMAQAYLQKKGYQILEKNWRYKRAEIDIIALDKSSLVFVEVKTRSTSQFGRPEEFISFKKQQLLADAAMVYIESINHEQELRFDIISVESTLTQIRKIDHFEDAFFPSTI